MRKISEPVQKSQQDVKLQGIRSATLRENLNNKLEDTDTFSEDKLTHKPSSESFKMDEVQRNNTGTLSIKNSAKNRGRKAINNLVILNKFKKDVN